MPTNAKQYLNRQNKDEHNGTTSQNILDNNQSVLHVVYFANIIPKHVPKVSLK